MAAPRRGLGTRTVLESPAHPSSCCLRSMDGLAEPILGASLAVWPVELALLPEPAHGPGRKLPGRRRLVASCAFRPANASVRSRSVIAAHMWMASPNPSRRG